MIAVTTKAWTFTAAQTDLELEAVSATEAMVVYFVIATCSHANTGDVSARVGCATATLPAITNNSVAGNEGIAFTHGGIAPGGGAVAQFGGAALIIGAAGADLRITCSAATGGDLRVNVGYQILDLTEG